MVGKFIMQFIYTVVSTGPINYTSEIFFGHEKAEHLTNWEQRRDN